MEIANFLRLGPLDFIHIECMRSYHKNGFKVILWCLEDYDVPEFIEKKNANDILNFNSVKNIKHYKNGKLLNNYVLYSDLFRMKVLKKDCKHNWWFDTDQMCISDVKNFIELKDNRDWILGYYNDENVTDLKSPGVGVVNIINEKILDEFIKIQNKILEDNDYIIKIYSELCIDIISDMINNNTNLKNQLLPPEILYPFAPQKFQKFLFKPKFLKDTINITKNSLTFHVWENLLKSANLLPNCIDDMKDGCYMKNIILSNYKF